MLYGKYFDCDPLNADVSISTSGTVGNISNQICKKSTNNRFLISLDYQII